jgi:type II secretory pathway component PulM
MAKRGRPRKDPSERITQFGMTLAELQALEAIAEEKNRSVSQIVRAAGTAVLANPELLDQVLRDMDASAAGVAIPGPDSDT